MHEPIRMKHYDLFSVTTNHNSAWPTACTKCPNYEHQISHPNSPFEHDFLNTQKSYNDERYTVGRGKQPSRWQRTAF